MTLDELTELTGALLEEAGFTLVSLRNGSEALTGLSDEQFLLATRFIAGERVTAEYQTSDDYRYLAQTGRERRLISEDEAARRLAALEELDEETPREARQPGGRAPVERDEKGQVHVGDGVFIL